MEELRQAAMALAILGASLDVLTKKIPNWLTLSGMLIGLIAQFFVGGLLASGQGALGIFTAFVFFAPLFFAGKMGGGDVKMLMMIGAFFGPKFVALLAIASLLVGGVYAAFDTLFQGRLLHVFRVALGWLQGMILRHQVKDFLDEDRKFSFGVAIAIALALVIVLESRGSLPWLL